MNDGAFRQAYLSGKYMDDNDHVILRNIALACEAGVLVAKAGLRPIIPHTSGDHRVTWEKAMTRCDEIFQSLRPGHDLIVLLPGWEQSRESKVEKEWAERLGIEVVGLHDLLVVQLDGISA